VQKHLDSDRSVPLLKTASIPPVCKQEGKTIQEKYIYEKQRNGINSTSPCLQTRREHTFATKERKK